ncbi:CRISPR-associated endoribonuclease Cas6 [Clostridium sp. WLY-B-L2]|jgi:CRISPR-associated endoribonuclease Cas6|uniref:CRISPR-associated endoribonuclease Cas6 n=1 Tax=Clostridium aromativorans TaxID=2836848 RepID=A0ABS8N7A0_9CLOT|nr:CRISPR-associated endoribonuclease Cas6 [Clostridium aromativorans]MCC9294950.1 CRISPR-associated endoribonuclease Cas6 [Clostridium aromativorans]
MNFFQLTITTFLNKDIPFNESGEFIGNIISSTMLLKDTLKEIHEKKEFKYVYDNFYPLEKSKVYEKGRIYVFNIRSFNSGFIRDIKRFLSLTKNNDFKIVAVEERRIKQRFITELYTKTAAIVTVDSKPWLLKDGDLMLLQKRFQDNLEKKFKDIYGEAIGIKQSFIQRVDVINKKPISFKYKNIHLLGNKFKITINEDEKSQQLAFIALGMGLGEKGSSVGAGFCHANYL